MQEAGSDGLEATATWIRHTLQELLGQDRGLDDPLRGDEVDSLVLEQLIDQIEERYLILLDAEDTARPNFADVRTLAGVVLDRREATRVSGA